MQYRTPTPVQVKVIPEDFSRKRCIGKVPNRKRQNCFFGIPLCELVEWDENRPQALVLAPTRELAIQVKKIFFILDVIRELMFPYYLDVLHLQTSTGFKTKTHIVVGTPGRVLDHMERKTLDTSAIRYLVIDEADEMSKYGILEAGESNYFSFARTPCYLVSATMPKEIERLAQAYLHHPVVLKSRLKP